MKYYVYELINSLDNKPFYVGKGTGNRMFVHEHRAKRNHVEAHENRHLRNKILSIWNNGGKIIYNQIFFTDNDMDAYKKETERIEEIGLKELCNVYIAPPTPEELYKLRARQMLGKRCSEETRQKISNTLMGHPVSDKTRKKIGDKQRGKTRPCSERRRISIAKSKMPVGGFPHIMSPSGQQVEITVLTDFCKTYGLRVSNMSDVLHGRAKSHKGWRLYIANRNGV